MPISRHPKRLDYGNLVISMNVNNAILRGENEMKNLINTGTIINKAEALRIIAALEMSTREELVNAQEESTEVASNKIDVMD